MKNIKIFWIILILLIWVLFFANLLYAQEQVLFNTEVFTFNSNDGIYIFNIQVFKKIFKDEPFYEISLLLQSKIFVGIDKAFIEIKADRKSIRLYSIKKSYKSWFDNEKNIWNEKLSLKIKYEDFEIFLKSSLDFLVIKTKDIFIENPLPLEFKKLLTSSVNYAKEIGVDVEKAYKPFFIIGFQDFSFPVINVNSQLFNTLSILSGYSFKLDFPLIDFLSLSFDFSFYLPIKFFIFNSFNFKIINVNLPFLSKDYKVFLFNISGIFTGVSIHLFSLFKIISFNLDISPGFFMTTIYDNQNQNYYPVLTFSSLTSYFLGTSISLNIDLLIFNDFYISLSLSSKFNVVFVFYNSIEIRTLVGF